IAMIGEPTSTVEPSSWKIRVTLPAHFAGISTAALAVSTSTIGWFSVMMSPSATSQRRISPSVNPSPRSGSGNSFTRDMPSPTHRAVDGVEHAVQARQVLLFDPRGRVRDVVPGDPQDRSLEGVEALLGHASRDLGADTAVARGLVDDDEPAGTTYRVVDRSQVERRNRPQVDHLELAPLLTGRGGGVERGLDHRSIRDNGRVRAWADHSGGEERARGRGPH